MSEFPEWVERVKGVWWSPDNEEAEEIHQALKEGRMRDPRRRTVWWRTLPLLDRRKKESA